MTITTWTRTATLALLSLALTPAALLAQPRVEVGANLGWTFSDGVDGDPFLAGDGNLYDRIDPKDSFSWGFNAGFLIGEQAEVGFMYGNQPSTLLIGGTAERELGDLTINSYHGYFGYNFAPSDSPIIPFVYGGLGATNYSEVTTEIGGVATPRQTITIPGETQFSTTWGGGVKLLTSPRFGLKVTASWTPTYIKSDAAGWWCDPYWGCYLVGNAQYSNQLTIGGGVLFRF